MNTLALDLGLLMGFAMEGPALPTVSGTQRFDKTGASPGMRFLEFRKWLEKAAYLPGAILAHVDIIVFEEAYQKGAAAWHSYGGFRGVLLEFCEQRGVEYRPVGTTVLKKWATGKGNAGKPEMVAEARRRHPEVDLIDDNHADALLLLDYALAELVPAAGRST